MSEYQEWTEELSIDDALEDTRTQRLGDTLSFDRAVSDHPTSDSELDSHELFDQGWSPSYE